MDPDLLLLSYDVTYFNHNGWEDTFADSRWDKRQQAYLRKWNRNTKFTPQVIVDGISDGTGAEKGAGEFSFRTGFPLILFAAFGILVMKTIDLLMIPPSSSPRDCQIFEKPPLVDAMAHPG